MTSIRSLDTDVHLEGTIVKEVASTQKSIMQKGEQLLGINSAIRLRIITDIFLSLIDFSTGESSIRQTSTIITPTPMVKTKFPFFETLQEKAKQFKGKNCEYIL